MFYSHQLLARKAPLGQIWMAATLHSKINRKKLSKLNIIKICEQILNPSVPMALRISGILMGGVVIVYERKVKLLYDDVQRLMVQINEAWKVKDATDPTLLPKSKLQAKYESITLPENQGEELPEIELTMRYSDADTVMGFEQTSYIEMRLDNVDLFGKSNAQKDPAQDFHQADADNITLADHFESHQADTDMFDRFERFDIEGNEEMQMNFTQPEHTDMPSTLVPSPPQEAAHQADEIPDRHPEDQGKQQSGEAEDVFEQRKDEQRPKPARRRARKAAGLAIDDEQTIVPGEIYQSWLQSSSDITSRIRKKRKTPSASSSRNITRLMEVPPIALLEGLLTNGNREVHYAAPLLELWMRSTQPPHDSPSGKTSPPFPLEPSYTSPAERLHNFQSDGYPFGDFHSGVGSQSVGIPIEKQREGLNNTEIAPETLIEELRANLTNVRLHPTGASGVNKTNHKSTPASGDGPRSISSSGSSHGFLSQKSETNSSRSSKKRPFSASKYSGYSLETVAEENPFSPNFKMTRQSELSENGFTQDNEILMETGPTQTQFPVIAQPVDEMTVSIKMQLKSHFDTHGADTAECLNELTRGMTKTQAARLFYQTCVLATKEFIKVEQEVSYGNILISRGTKM